MIYNVQMPESKAVADHYAAKRGVPTNRIIALDLPITESMTRTEYNRRLRDPLKRELFLRDLFFFDPLKNNRVRAARPRYGVLCYGVPTKILKDTNLLEVGVDKMPEPLRRNEAAVDSELAALPLGDYTLAGPLANPLFAATNGAAFQPTNGVWMVARLDGPTPEIAKGLVDKAILTESNGLWGRAYFDTRGLTNGEYVQGDVWIDGAATVASNVGYQVEIDAREATWPVSFPMSSIALYAGWYDWHVSGPFTRREVDFMPGAVAYHLHSFSAATIRATNQNWVGPLLAKGATATLGCVDEPYLSGTPNLRLLFAHLLGARSSFGEAAYAAQNVLSWQTIVVGDPLYRPFLRAPDVLHKELELRGDVRADWSNSRVIGLNLAMGSKPGELIDALEKFPRRHKSAVLTQQLGDLYWASGKFTNAFDAYATALKLETLPRERERLLLRLADLRAAYGPDRVALDFYQQYLKEFPDDADARAVYQKMLPLAERAGAPELAALCTKEIQRLTSASTAAKP